MTVPIHAIRLKAAREDAGLSQNEVASAVGLSPANYYDLESHDDLTMCISLAELCKICEVVHVEPRKLFGDSSSELQIPLAVVVQRIKEHCNNKGMTVSQFEEKVGWAVKDCLEAPESALAKWNVHCLKDICGELGIDWLTVLPA